MGGSKSPTVVAQAPKPMRTTNTLGTQLDITVPTLDTSKTQEKSIDKKKLGTRGLRIPLEAPTSTTNRESTPASTGLQV